MGTHFPPTQRRPQWSPSIHPISVVWSPWSACTPRPQRPSLGSRDWALDPCCSVCLPLPVCVAPDLPPASGGPLQPGRRSGGCSGPAAPGLPSPLTPRPTPLPSSWRRSLCSYATPETPRAPSALCRPRPRAASSAHSLEDPAPAPGFLLRCPRASFLLFDVPAPAAQKGAREPTRLACLSGPRSRPVPSFPELPSAGFGPTHGPEASGRPGQDLYTILPSKGREAARCRSPGQDARVGALSSREL